jgi:hypothetical protein
VKPIVLALAGLLLAALAGTARAEPYLAIRQGLKCAACHQNPTGGGMRTALGNSWAQGVLAEHRLDIPGVGPWMGSIGRYLSLGGDLRYDESNTSLPHQPSVKESGISEGRVYVQLNLLPDRFQLYLDERLAPGGALRLESYAKLWLWDRQVYVKAGQMFLPYGLRLQDDAAFIRQVPGINFTTPDNGAEIGIDRGPWAAQLAVSRGTAGGPEIDSGKQWSLRVERVQPLWRLGASFNYNDSSAGKRRMQNLFVGLRTGTVSWLAEADYIVDEGLGPSGRRQWAALVEADWNFHAGHNLKLTAESFDPDTVVQHDRRTRLSVVWEYTPLPYVQLRVGGRLYQGIPQNDSQNRRLAFAELHLFF